MEYFIRFWQVETNVDLDSKTILVLGTWRRRGEKWTISFTLSSLSFVDVRHKCRVVVLLSFVSDRKESHDTR